MLLEIIKVILEIFFVFELAFAIVSPLFRNKKMDALLQELFQYRVAKKPDPFVDPEGYEGFDCPSCHAFLDEKQAFCSECGQKILWKNEDKE